MLVRLATAAFVASDNPKHPGEHLGPGSVIFMISHTPEPSPNGLDEIPIRMLTSSMGEARGWLSPVALVTKVTKATELTNNRDDLDAGPLDRLRCLHAMSRVKNPPEDFTFVEWLRKFGSVHKRTVASAVRELGSIVREAESVDELNHRLLTLAYNHKEYDMSESATEDAPKTRRAKSEKTAAPAKSAKRTEKAPKAEKTKRAPREESEGGPSASQNVGKLLVSLLKKSGADVGKASDIAAKMADGKTATAGQLEALRDGINVAAATAREREKTDLASELSAANRTVRRLARAAAAE